MSHYTVVRSEDETMDAAKIVLGDIKVYWRSIIIVFAPILLIPILTIGTNESYCAYAVLLMAIYWMTEVLPLAVTAFFPIFLFPLFGILDVRKTCQSYLKDTNFLFVGGLIVAIAVEESNLHKRIALKVLSWVGARPRWLMLGFMAVTAFLSMWISNTATTAMMVPIAIAVLEKLTENSNPNNIALLERGSNHANASNSTAVARRNTERFPEKKDELRKKSLADITLNYEQMTPQDRGVCKAVLLSICYAANIGGTGTLTGTGPNLVLRGQLDAYYKGADTGITFATWMGFEIPPLIVYLISAWLLLQVVFMTPEWLGGRKKQKKVESKDDVAAMIKRSYEELGAMKFIEWSTLFWFLLLVVLWVMRDPRFVPGWAAWFGERSNEISDASAAMFVACVMFAWPKEAPDFFCLRRDKHQVAQKREPLVTWAIIQRKFPWSVIMLLGGGFALAEGVRESKLSSWIGCELQHALHTLPTPAILAIFTVIITFVTEVTSNTATASIFIPIMLSIAENLKINPLYFALPATIAPSFAFMLPVATPPNAIVYEVGALRIIDMMIAGFFMNWLAIAATLININTYGYFFYDLGTYPTWASQANRTSIC